MNKEKCKYCNGLICNGKRKTIAEWNKCPWQKADWEVSTSLVMWILNILSFGIIGELIFRYKLTLK